MKPALQTERRSSRNLRSLDRSTATNTKPSQYNLRSLWNLRSVAKSTAPKVMTASQTKLRSLRNNKSVDKTTGPRTKQKTNTKIRTLRNHKLLEKSTKLETKPASQSKQQLFRNQNLTHKSSAQKTKPASQSNPQNMGEEEVEELPFETLEPEVFPEHSSTASLLTQKAKKPIFVKDIMVTSNSDKQSDLYSSVVLSNQQILVTSLHNKKVKLIDTYRNKIISEIRVSGKPFDVTRVTDDEFAVTMEIGNKKNPNTIQFISVTQQSLSKGRTIAVSGNCRGIAYNDKDKTLVVTYVQPAKVEILNMEGTVFRCLEKDCEGDEVFLWPESVVISPNIAYMYITDKFKGTVTLITMDGEVKTLYKESSMEGPVGICVHKSGLVYVVGACSFTIHQLDPVSGEFKLLLEGRENGIAYPGSISYCDFDNKLYIGLFNSGIIKVFQMV